MCAFMAAVCSLSDEDVCSRGVRRVFRTGTSATSWTDSGKVVHNFWPRSELQKKNHDHIVEQTMAFVNVGCLASPPIMITYELVKFTTTVTGLMQNTDKDGDVQENCVRRTVSRGCCLQHRLMYNCAIQTCHTLNQIILPHKLLILRLLQLFSEINLFARSCLPLSLSWSPALKSNLFVDSSHFLERAYFHL